PEKAPAYLVQAVLGFNEQLERIAELTVVLLLGGMLTIKYLSVDALWFAPLLFFIIRPIAVALGSLGTGGGALQFGLMAWFGVRGVGSIYYLLYAVNRGLLPHVAGRLTALVFTVVAASIVAHGISVTPLMNLYRGRRGDSAQGRQEAK
ncbi:MAG TPA: sodium:proton antiporter, partial [Blastocatellia bacterium]|nr:sodium:proton antiporter [Blastocatellia bacterium]